MHMIKILTLANISKKVKTNNTATDCMQFATEFLDIKK